jgi:hypothetical protein
VIDHDALPLPLRAAFSLDRRFDVQGLLVPEEVIVVEPMLVGASIFE